MATVVDSPPRAFTAVTTSTLSDTPPSQLAKASRKEKLQFADLSEEIKGLILERLIRPSHLKNVCLVNKELHQIAVRFLYHNVALDLGCPNDTRLSAFLSPRNIGLKYVRQLRLYLAIVYDKCNQEQQAQFATRIILEFLPEDVLEEFSWCPWRPFSTDNLLLLYKKQRKMKWLEVMDLDRNVLPDLKKDLQLQITLFQNARKLALYPENRDTLNLSGYFVQRTRERLEELIVHCNFGTLDSRDSLDTRDVNDSATAPGLLSNTIFSCVAPVDQSFPFPNLRSLRLHKVNLRYCADTWCRSINFHDLQYLRLYHCNGADTLLGQLSKASQLPKQLKVLEVQHRDNSENEALIALDGFLCLVSGLRDLVIDLEHVKSLPAAAGIARHGKTLELLNVHCTPENHASITASESEGDELVWEVEELEKICKACPDLEQLSCAWPQTSLIRSPSDEWRAFENACSLLRKLVTLHVTTWPTNKPSTQLLPRSIYETMLQSLAQRGFELTAGTQSSSLTASPPTEDVENAEDAEDESEVSEDPPPLAKLRLIAFGTSDKIYEREDSKNQIIFLRSTCIDADGKQKPYATPIGWCVRQYEEPRSEVLDFVLHQADRSNKPPCREHRDTTTWGDEDEFVLD